MFYTNEELKVIANVVADKTGVQLSEEGDNWKVNSKKKIIYYPEGTVMTDVEIGYIVHESAHLRFSFMDIKFFKDLENLLKPLGKDFDQLYKLFEMIEDVRVDSSIMELYIGASQFLLANIESDFSTQCDSIAKAKMFNHKDFKDYVENKKWTQFLYYVMTFAYLGEFYADMWLEYMHKDAIEASKKAVKFIPLMETAKNGKDMFNILDKLLPLYIPLCDDIDEEKEKEKEEQKKEQDKKLDELMKQLMEALKKMFQDAQKRKEQGGAGDGKRKDKKKDEKGEDESEGEGGDGIGAKKGKDEEGDEEEGKGGSSSGDEEDEDVRELDIVKPGGKGLKREDREKVFGTSYTDFNLDALNEELNINLPKVRKAMSVLKDLDTERYEGNYESGKLQNRRLYKLMAGKTKVFTRKIAEVNTDKNMAVAIVVDESGSMSRLGDYREGEGEFTYKCHYACISTALISKALELTHKPYAVYGFNKHFETHKDWNKKLDLREILNVVANAEGKNRGYGHNNDGYAIWRVVRELEKRPERNKVMIVLSDGRPTEFYGRSKEENKFYRDYNLKDEVRKAEKIAKVYGIGIADDSVEKYYSRFKVIDDVSQLATALTKIFNENTGKRMR